MHGYTGEGRSCYEKLTILYFRWSQLTRAMAMEALGSSAGRGLDNAWLASAFPG